jgi:hypothetical protein
VQVFSVATRVPLFLRLDNNRDRPDVIGTLMHWQGRPEGGKSLLDRALPGPATAGLDRKVAGSAHGKTKGGVIDASGLALLTVSLMQAGFSEQDMAAILGGDVLRVLRATLPLGTGYRAISIPRCGKR